MGTDSIGGYSSNGTISHIASDERIGIVPRAVGQIFSEVQKRSRNDPGRWRVEAKCSYIEIYSE